MNETQPANHGSESSATPKHTTPPGLRSIAFWVVLAGALANFASDISEILPAEYAPAVVAVVVAVRKALPFIKTYFSGGDGK